MYFIRFTRLSITMKSNIFSRYILIELFLSVINELKIFARIKKTNAFLIAYICYVINDIKYIKTFF